MSMEKGSPLALVFGNESKEFSFLSQATLVGRKSCRGTRTEPPFRVTLERIKEKLLVNLLAHLPSCFSLFQLLIWIQLNVNVKLRYITETLVWLSLNGGECIIDGALASSWLSGEYLAGTKHRQRNRDLSHTMATLETRYMLASILFYFIFSALGNQTIDFWSCMAKTRHLLKFKIVS